MFSIRLDVNFGFGKPESPNDCSSLQLGILGYVGFLRFCYCSPESLLKVGGPYRVYYMIKILFDRKYMLIVVESLLCCT